MITIIAQKRVHDCKIPVLCILGDLNPESYIGVVSLLYCRCSTSMSYEQLSNSNDLKLCTPLTSAILVDIKMRFSHYRMFSDSTQTQSAALTSMTHPAIKLRWTKPVYLEQMRDLFLNTLRFLYAGKYQQDATKSGHFDGNSKTLDFFTFMADVDESYERHFSFR